MTVLSSGRVIETRPDAIVLITQWSSYTLEEHWAVTSPGDALPGDTVEVNDDGTLTIVNRQPPEQIIIAPTSVPPPAG